MVLCKKKNQSDHHGSPNTNIGHRHTTQSLTPFSSNHEYYIEPSIMTIVGLTKTLEGRYTGDIGCEQGICGLNVVVGDTLTLSLGHITIGGIPK